MRTSDARYRQVRRTKREVDLFPEMASALAGAKADPAKRDELVALIERSADEFRAVFLASGRTSTDFRRAYRRGSARWNIVDIEALIGRDAAKANGLCGFTLQRLHREQIWNVKDRAEKVLLCDRLLNDPAGKAWTEILLASLYPGEQHVGIIETIQARGDQLGDGRQSYGIVPHVHAETIEHQADWPSNDALLPFAARQFLLYRQRRDGIRWDQWRGLMTTPVRMLEAYLGQRSMMAARYGRADENPRELPGRFLARVATIEEQLGQRLAQSAAKWNGERPEAYRYSNLTQA